MFFNFSVIFAANNLFKVEKGFNQSAENLFTEKVRAGKRRTYFFDVRQTKGDDYFVTITESTKRSDGNGYERHKIFLYKEDFNRFIQGLENAVNHVKNDLMPDYDYEEFDRRQEEWEREQEANAMNETGESSAESSEESDDMSW